MKTRDVLIVVLIVVLGIGAYYVVKGYVPPGSDEWGRYVLKVSAFVWMDLFTAPHMDTSSVVFDFITSSGSPGSRIVGPASPAFFWTQGNMVFVVYGRYLGEDTWLRGKDVHASFDEGRANGATMTTTMDLHPGFGRQMDVIVIFVGESRWNKWDKSNPEAGGQLVDAAYWRGWLTVPAKDSPEWA